MAKQGLIIVDIQNDYFEGGRWTLSAMDQAAAKAQQAIAHFRNNGQPLYHVQHIFEGDNAPFFAAGSVGADIHASVAPQGKEQLFVKTTINPYVSTDLLSALRGDGVEEVVVIGAMSHMCIDATVRASADYGFKVTVLEDACATLNLEFNGETVPAKQVHNAYMAALGFAYAEVTTTEAFLGGEQAVA